MPISKWDRELDKYRGIFRLARDIHYLWTEEATAFICPCGQEIQLTEGGHTALCDCGKVYRLVVKVMVDDQIASAKCDLYLDTHQDLWFCKNCGGAGVQKATDFVHEGDCQERT